MVELGDTMLSTRPLAELYVQEDVAVLSASVSHDTLRHLLSAARRDLDFPYIHLNLWTRSTLLCRVYSTVCISRATSYTDFIEMVVTLSQSVSQTTQYILKQLERHYERSRH